MYNVQIEAMRCGVPVVSSDLYGVRTIVRNTGAGLISKAGDEQDLARCIINVIDSKENYSEVLLRASKQYSNEVWEQKYVSALLEG